MPALNLAIDTGTARSVIDRRIARQLSLPRSRVSMEVFGTRLETEGATIRALSFGPIVAENLEVLVADLGPQRERFGVQLDALIGADVLRGRCVTIDYESRRLVFDCTPAWPKRTSFTPPLPLVEVRIDGNIYRLIVDSGSEAIVLFEESLPAGAKVAPEMEVAARDLVGTRLLKRFTPERFLIGGHEIGTPPVFLLSGACSRCGYDGVLGTKWLPGERVYLDFRQGLLSWR